jgi:hypothetical protein
MIADGYEPGTAVPLDLLPALVRSGPDVLCIARENPELAERTFDCVKGPSLVGLNHTQKLACENHVTLNFDMMKLLLFVGHKEVNPTVRIDEAGGKLGLLLKEGQFSA